MLAEEDLRDASVLIFANKQDQSVMTVSEITDRLGLPNLKGREWFIQGTCALSGEGLFEGLDWLSKTLSKKKNWVNISKLYIQCYLFMFSSNTNTLNQSIIHSNIPSEIDSINKVNTFWSKS